MADTLASGASARKGMRVQVPLAAPTVHYSLLLRTRINVPGGTLSSLSALLVLHSKTPARSACEASFSKETTEQRHLAHLCLCAVSLKRVFQKKITRITKLSLHVPQIFAVVVQLFCLLTTRVSLGSRAGMEFCKAKRARLRESVKFLAGEFNACTRVVSKQKNYVTKPRNRIPYDANTPTSSNSDGSTTPSTSCRRSTRTSF